MMKTLALLAVACAGIATLSPASAMETGWRPYSLQLPGTRGPSREPWSHRLPVGHQPGKIQHTCYNIAGRPYQTTMKSCPIS